MAWENHIEQDDTPEKPSPRWALVLVYLFGVALWGWIGVNVLLKILEVR
jgi:hypothetical protein